jgi:hypothetical protein
MGKGNRVHGTTPCLRGSEVPRIYNTALDLLPWPKATAWIDRVERTPALAKFTTLAERAMTVRRAERRALFGEMGIALTETTFASEGFRKGPMSV